ncbi:RDD family protein [Luteibacter sp. 9135]|uniref:RDD family protein n=1 Tax=Luteibacter sp. 9135 TaxID=1500893 RepID=UPI000568230D|nr:RDD family protein [Luteibacter sp. 9135]
MLPNPPAPASAWRRFAAIVYDALAVVAIVMVVGLLAQMATGGQLFDAHGHLLTWWYQPLQGVAVGAYFLLSWVRGGQTLGMRPWRIRVTDARGDAVGWRRGLVRLAVAALPLALVLIFPLTSLRAALWAPLVGWAILLLPALVDRRRRALHDMAAGTEIRPLAP